MSEEEYINLILLQHQQILRNQILNLQVEENLDGIGYKKNTNFIQVYHTLENL